MKNKIILTAIITILLQSCGLMISGSKQGVTFKTNVDKGDVYSNLDNIGKTNVELEIPRTDLNKLYTIKKDGCRDTSFVLPIKENYVVLLDIPFTAISFIGSIPTMYDYAYDTNKKTNDVIVIELDCDSTVVTK